MFIMPERNGIDNTIEKRFEAFMRRFKIGQLLRGVNANKVKGMGADTLFRFLLGLVFTQKNLYTLLNTNKEKTSFEKDTIYRFLSDSKIRWEKFIRKLGAAAVLEVNKLTSDERRSALVIDDTPYYRNRSKKVEFLSRCYDHAERRFYKGFTMLTMGWTDGQTFIPVDYQILASGKDANLLEPSHIKEDGRTAATKRRTDARTGKPALVLKMLEAVRGTAAQAKYVLFDSWFASPSSILAISNLGYHVVARLKNHKNFRFIHNGEKLSIGQIFRNSPKRRGRSRYLLSAQAAIVHNDFEQIVPVKIVFVRDRNNRKKWIAFVSTDMSLSEDEIIALYGKRWDIEPFHKVLKSCLSLTKEFQLRSFDAITAHAAVVLSRYIFLTLESRADRDNRTLGELFFFVCDELHDISFEHSMSLILSALEVCLQDHFCLLQAQIHAFVMLFIDRLPCFIKDKLAFSLCES